MTSPPPKRPSVRKRARVFFRRIGVWLDAWCLRGYSQDTHDWGAKLHNLRRLKTTYRQLR